MTTNEELIALHKTACEYLQIKLKKIPARVFGGGRKPTIRDIYERPETLINPTVPKHLQLDFIFSNFNTFAEGNFMARKRDQNRQISAAIFYWDMDRKHSLSTHYEDIRYNILLAHLVLEDPKSRSQLDENLATFLQWLIYAWLETAMRVEIEEDESRNIWIYQIWKQRKFDLIRWTNKRQSQKMAAAVHALKIKVSKPPFDVDQFWTEAREQSAEDFRRHGASWALQYIIYKEQEAKDILAGDLVLEAQDSLNNGSLVSHFAGLGMDLGDSVPEHLSEALFEQPLVKALLVDITDDITFERPQGLRVLPNEGTESCWMKPEEALALLEGKVAGLEDITEQLSSMNFLK
ncbi:hypothetical protein GMOD_00004663 [Pyrenophora seminiperda CCB06]|uniref:Uncharacterized protein n=1 Tax=Pyrenophora seminiperda CCB06 TaxID=1302712 RepID=A0A3M7MHQ9_9PLEO|nr:hypothetical protein GMOD_00004663 [Pyrenophora seminiperda CCB06]